MSSRRRHRPLLSDIAPTFAEELVRSLQSEGEAGLAAQVPELHVLSFCGCGEPECASFTTRATEDRAVSPQVETIALDSLDGMVNVDTVGGQIVYVEVLYRADLRSALEAGFPRARASD
jgi:hypothetical protein